jgi:hypothetical protein
LEFPVAFFHPGENKKPFGGGQAATGQTLGRNPLLATKRLFGTLGDGLIL